MLYPTLLLIVGAFCLGACPFSLWIGRRFLGKDIREYGDANPGATNVFSAGGHASGWLAVFADTAKGAPFVILAHSLFALPEAAVMAIAVSAIAGHSFSPFLHFKGGKSVAVTFGALLGLLPEGELLLLFTVFTCIGALLMANHAWTVMAGPTGSLIYLLVSGAIYWQSLFMLSVLVLLGIKHCAGLRTSPGLGVQPFRWIRARRLKA
ncbi:MAG: glycerol-3-phosphate acyltransferase [Dehalococcoidia bacterium]|nr:glycerol-3-phosphate acyltransferase [Dehalococcoidia bacterium]